VEWGIIYGMIYVIPSEVFVDFMEGVCSSTLLLDKEGEDLMFVLPNGDSLILSESSEGFELKEVGRNAGRFIIHHHNTYN
jgi:hypothetical protein